MWLNQITLKENMKLIKTFSQETKKGIFFVKVYKNADCDEYCCIPFEKGITPKEQEDRTYFTADKQDALMTAATMVDNMALPLTKD